MMSRAFRLIHIAVVTLLSLSLVFVSSERNRLWKTPVIILNDIIRKSPRKVRSYNNLGYYYYRKGMLDDALIAFQASLVWNPRYAKGFCNVGAVYVEKKSYNDAIRFLNRAVALQPDFAIAHFNLGLAHEAEGNRVLALEYFKKAAAEGNEDARIAIDRISTRRGYQTIKDTESKDLSAPYVSGQAKLDSQ